MEEGEERGGEQERGSERKEGGRGKREEEKRGTERREGEEGRWREGLLAKQPCCIVHAPAMLDPKNDTRSASLKKESKK